MSWIDSVSTSLISKNLDGLWERQKAISDNMANYETPGYKTKSVSFEDQLQEQLLTSGDTTSTGLINKIADVKPKMTIAKDEKYRADGNGVDLEQQNIELARTELNYIYSLQEISDNFSRLSTAITGGK